MDLNFLYCYIMKVVLVKFWPGSRSNFPDNFQADSLIQLGTGSQYVDLVQPPALVIVDSLSIYNLQVQRQCQKNIQ